MDSVLRRLAQCVVPILLSCGVGGCMLADSQLVAVEAEVGCQDRRNSSLGSYYLPKSYFEVSVYRWRNPDTKDDFYKLQFEGTYTRADPSRLFCLNYLASTTSKDSVRAFKTDEGVLGKISSRAEDQTAEIIKKLLQTIFTLIIGFGSGDDASAGRSADGAEFEVPWIEVFKAQYDPTDQGEAAFLNDRLKDFGLCLLSQDHLTEGRPAPGQYCEDPMAAAAWTPRLSQGQADLKTPEAEPASLGRPERSRGVRDVPQNGVFYRPRLPYDIYLFTRVNRKVPGHWSFRRKATIDIENHAPIISVGVDRSFFATRTTLLEFDHGVLTDVRLFKSSELQSFVEIPIYIAQQLWMLPTNIVRYRVDQFANEATLKRAESKLLQAELARLNASKGVVDPAQAAAFRNYTRAQAKP